MKWFLIYTATVLPPPCGGIDCGINSSYRSTYAEQRIEMPSLEVCREVRKINAGSKCLTEDVESEPQKTGMGSPGIIPFDKLWQDRNLPGATIVPQTQNN